MSTDLDDIRKFLNAMDTVAAGLNPPKRAQDQAIAACSPREIRVLQALGQHAPLKMSELSAIVAAPLSTTTRIIDTLAAKGLVERRPSPTDGRIVEVVFGPLGKQINRYIDKSRQASAKALLAKLTDKQQQQLLSLLTAMTDQ